MGTVTQRCYTSVLRIGFSLTIILYEVVHHVELSRAVVASRDSGHNRAQGTPLGTPQKEGWSSLAARIEYSSLPFTPLEFSRLLEEYHRLSAALQVRAPKPTSRNKQRLKPYDSRKQTPLFVRCSRGPSQLQPGLASSKATSRRCVCVRQEPPKLFSLSGEW